MTEFFNELLIIFFDWFELIFALIVGLILLQFLGIFSSTTAIKKTPSRGSFGKKSPREFLGYTFREIKKEDSYRHSGYKAGLEKLQKLKPAISLSEGVEKVEEYAKHCGYDQLESTKISTHFKNCFEQVKAVYEEEKIKREGRRSTLLTRTIDEQCDILAYDCRKQLLRFMHYIRLKKSFTDVIHIQNVDIDSFVKVVKERDN